MRARWLPRRSDFPAESVPVHAAFTGLAVFYAAVGCAGQYGALALAAVAAFAEAFLLWAMRSLSD